MRGCAWLAAVLWLTPGATAEEPRRVPDFSLTERSGRTISRADLEGKTWVAACFFTCCNQACPKITANLARLHEQLAAYDDVVLVSISVYPQHDTADRLRDYAAAHGADPDRWLFLTGEEEAVYRLIKDGFSLHVEQNSGEERRPGNEVLHSNKLVLVDRRGVIQGYFDGTDDGEVEQLRRRLVRMHEVLPGLDIGRLPMVNAGLNTTSALFLLLGYLAIRLGRVALHKTCMLAALGVSALFLASYLFYHYHAGATEFSGTGPIRIVYFTVLISHTILAVVAAPLALFTAWQGIRNQLPRHVRIARWTLPIWIYVSVTGVVVYWMLYHL